MDLHSWQNWTADGKNFFIDLWSHHPTENSSKLKTSRSPPAKRLLTERLWNWPKWQKKANSFLKIKVSYTNIKTTPFSHKASSSAGLLIYHSILSFFQNVVCFLNTVVQWLVLLFVTRVRQTGSDRLTAHHPVISTLDRCVGGGKENDSTVRTDTSQEIISSLWPLAIVIKEEIWFPSED